MFIFGTKADCTFLTECQQNTLICDSTTINPDPNLILSTQIQNFVQYKILCLLRSQCSSYCQGLFISYIGRKTHNLDINLYHECPSSTSADQTCYDCYTNRRYCSYHDFLSIIYYWCHKKVRVLCFWGKRSHFNLQTAIIIIKHEKLW